MIIASGSNPGIAGRRTARCAAPLEELDDDHATAAAGTWRATLGCGAVRISGAVCLSCVVRCRRLCRRLRGGDQLPGSCDVGFAAGPCEQPVVAGWGENLWEGVEEEAAGEIVGGKGDCAKSRPPLPALVLFGG